MYRDILRIVDSRQQQVSERVFLLSRGKSDSGSQIPLMIVIDHQHLLN